MSASPEPVRRKRHDRSQTQYSSIPIGNPAARWAYIFTLLGLIPGVGILLGLPAIVLGVVGRRAALRDEQKRGLGHAYVSRVLGAFEFVSQSAGLFCLGIAWNWW